MIGIIDWFLLLNRLLFVILFFFVESLLFSIFILLSYTSFNILSSLCILNYNEASI
jgi:hypothetical protein